MAFETTHEPDSAGYATFDYRLDVALHRVAHASIVGQVAKLDAKDAEGRGHAYFSAPVDVDWLLDMDRVRAVAADEIAAIYGAA